MRHIVFETTTQSQIDAVRALLAAYGFRPFCPDLGVGTSVRVGVDAGATAEDRGRLEAPKYTGNLADKYEVIATLRPVDPPLPNIGEHKVTVTKDGVKVGCTFVPWKTIEKIQAARPK